MFRQLFVSFALFSVAFACDASESEGPCDGTLLTCQTQVCDTSAGQCCPVTTAAASATSTTVSSDSTSSTVSSSATTVTSSSSSSTTTCADRLNPSTGVSDCPALAYLCNDSTYYTVMTQQCPKTCGRCNSTTTSSSSSCADLLNPSTGVSDCPSRASLCNDSTYYAVMTQQCPKTCGRCNSTSTTTSTSSTTCADRSNPTTGVSDCPSRAALCNNAVYYSLMTVQCPVTCGRCTTNSTSSSSSCTDRVNPSTGVSDCSARASLCNNSVYYDLMTVQCPATCGRCNSSSSTTSSSSSSTTASSTCVDQVNAATGVSDCPNRVAYCTNSAYITLMRTQCPLTCGFCTSG